MRNSEANSGQLERYLRRESEFANGMRRLVAFLIDSFIVYRIILVVGTILDEAGSDSSFNGVFTWEYAPGNFDTSFDAIAFVLWFGYFIIQEWLIQRTPGKWLLRIRVVSADAPRIGLRSAVIRNLMKYPEILLFVFLWPLWFVIAALIKHPLPGWITGALRVLWSPYNQRWGDELAGTYVIKGQWYPVRLGSGAVASSDGGEMKTGIRLSRRAKNE